MVVPSDQWYRSILFVESTTVDPPILNIGFLQGNSLNLVLNLSYFLLWSFLRFYQNSRNFGESRFEQAKAFHLVLG
jgi:hypothetical protein